MVTRSIYGSLCFRVPFKAVCVSDELRVFLEPCPLELAVVVRNCLVYDVIVQALEKNSTARVGEKENNPVQYSTSKIK